MLLSLQYSGLDISMDYTVHGVSKSPHGGSEGKASACNAGDPGSIPGSGRSPGEGNGNPLQYSCLKNPNDRGVWQARVHGITKSQTRLSDFHFHCHVHAYKVLSGLLTRIGASLVAQRIKHLPAMQETQVRFLGWEDPLEKKMATHSSVLAWRIPWTEEPGELHGVASAGHNLGTKLPPPP